MKSYFNSNPRFGHEGPFHATSPENIADDMSPCFEVWSDESGCPVEDLRAEFLLGLVEVD